MSNISRSEIKEILKKDRIISAIKDEQGLNDCLNNKSKVVFILFGTVMNICDTVKKLKNAGKICFVHIDLIEGLASKEVAVEFVAKNTGADGIITTKQSLVKCAASHGLLTVQRFFLIDSLALDNLTKQIKSEQMDVIEVLPGFSGKIISEIVKKTELPVIASGLLRDKNDIDNALNSGATAVSSTNRNVWI